MPWCEDHLEGAVAKLDLFEVTHGLGDGERLARVFALGETFRQRLPNPTIADELFHIVVVSALGGITNLLIKASELALNNDEGYQEVVDQIELRHFSAIEELLHHDNQIVCKAEVAKRLNKLKEVLNGVALLNDLSDKTSARIVGLGEILSSFIIYHAMLQENTKVKLV